MFQGRLRGPCCPACVPTSAQCPRAAPAAGPDPAPTGPWGCVKGVVMEGHLRMAPSLQGFPCCHRVHPLGKAAPLHFQSPRSCSLGCGFTFVSVVPRDNPPHKCTHVPGHAVSSRVPGYSPNRGNTDQRLATPHVHGPHSPHREPNGTQQVGEGAGIQRRCWCQLQGIYHCTRDPRPLWGQGGKERGEGQRRGRGQCFPVLRCHKSSVGPEGAHFEL